MGCFVASIASVIPVARLSCKCTNFGQCHSLKAFTPKGEEVLLLNPFPEPNLERFAKSRRIPYNAAPGVAAKTKKSFSKKLAGARNFAKVGSGFAEVDGNFSVAIDAHARGQRHTHGGPRNRKRHLEDFGD